MTSYEVKIRNEFFITTLFVEDMITSCLSEKLAVKDIVNSNFLGNNEKSITFDQKIDWLIESDYFSIIDNSKLSVFKAIRNELLIHKETESFEKSFTSKDGNDDFLLILYPQSDYLPREEKLTSACYQLIGEVSELVSRFTNKPEIKLERKSFGKQIYQSLSNTNLSKLAFLIPFLFLK